MEFKAHGFKTICNSLGMEVMINETSEEVTYRYSGYSGESDISTTSISYDMEGDAYFTEYRGPYDPAVHYLNEFMRISM